MVQDGERDLVSASARILPPETRSPGWARVFASEVMIDAGCSPDTISAACLVVSELVTNAVMHAGTPSILSVAVFDDEVRLEVEDGSTHPPVWRERSLLERGGRGLRIVESFGEVSVEPIPGGKRVSVRLPRR